MTRNLRRLLRDRSGNFAVMAALMMLPLVMAVGVGIDAARMYQVKARLASALDAAGLAAGSWQGGDAQLQAVATQFFQANFPATALGAAATPVLTISNDVITISATAQVDTVFMSLAHINTVTVSASSQVTRSTRGLELALVLDNTGSMVTNDNIGALRQAATDMTDILFGSQSVHPYLKVAVVPYAASVNPGDAVKALVTAADYAKYNPGSVSGWKGCVVERAPPNDMNDTTASAGYWGRYYWAPAADNDWTTTKPSTINANPDSGNAGTGPNLGCPTPIQPLSNDKSVVQATIASLQAWSRGGTLGNLGLAWGYRVLSPDAPFAEGLAWGTAKWDKALVLMTDGDNQFYKLTSAAGANAVNNAVGSDYSGYGRIDANVLGTTDANQGKTLVNQKLAAMCGALKAKGVIVYTVIFTSGINQATKDMYTACATDPGKYFYAPQQSDLKTAFRAIGRQLSNLRLSR